MYLIDYTTARALMEARLLEADRTRRSKGVRTSGFETDFRRFLTAQSRPVFGPPIHTAEGVR